MGTNTVILLILFSLAPLSLPHFLHYLRCPRLIQGLSPQMCLKDTVYQWRAITEHSGSCIIILSLVCVCVFIHIFMPFSSQFSSCQTKDTEMFILVFILNTNSINRGIKEYSYYNTIHSTPGSLGSGFPLKWVLF